MFTGTIVHSLSCGQLECLSPGIMAVDASGKILFCEEMESRTGRREDAEREAAKHLANLSDTPSDHDHAYVTDLDAVPPLSNDSRFEERGGRAHFTINDFEWIDLGPRLMIPGFVDAHVHAPQYGFMGLGVGLPLLQWLDKYTFPFESRFSDLGFATEMYSAAVVCSLDSHRSLLHPNFRINTRTQQQQTLNRHVICATEQHFQVTLRQYT